MTNTDGESLRIAYYVDQIRSIVADIPGCLLPVAEIDARHQFRQDLGLDSLAMVDLMVAAEDTFGVYFDPVKMDLEAAFDTPQSLAGLIAKLAKNRASNIE